MDEQQVGTILGGAIGIGLTLLLGLVIGVVAKLLTPGKDPGGWFATMLLGIAGAWVGSFAASLLNLGGTVAPLVLAVGGAVLLLLAYRVVKK